MQARRLLNDVSHMQPDPTKVGELRRWLTERLALYSALSTHRAVPIRWMRAFHLDYFFACGEPLLERLRHETAVQDIHDEFKSLFPEAPGGFIAFRRALLQYRELRGVPVPHRHRVTALARTA